MKHPKLFLLCLGLLGQTEAAVLGQLADSLIATPEDMAFWDDVRAGHASLLESDTVLVDGGGRLVQVHRRICALVGMPGPDAAQPPLLVVLHDRSAAQRELDERDLLVSELQATLESTADGILVTDLAGRMRSFNQRFASLWGIPDDLLKERNDEAVQAWMRRRLKPPLPPPTPPGAPGKPRPPKSAASSCASGLTC